MQGSNFGGTFDQLFLNFFYDIFTEDASLLLLYHGAKKSKMTKTSIQGGPALEVWLMILFCPLLKVNRKLPKHTHDCFVI